MKDSGASGQTLPCNKSRDKRVNAPFVPTLSRQGFVRLHPNIDLVTTTSLPGFHIRREKVVFLEESRTNRMGTQEMPWHGGCISIEPILLVPLFPSLVFLETWPLECHDQLVVRRRQSQQIARAGYRFCASSEVTEVCAGKRFCGIAPGHLDVIRCDLAGAEKPGVGAGNADRQRFAIAGKATGTARR